jgi:HK97 family phage prohead protease
MTVTVQHVRRRLARASVPARLTTLGADEFEGYASLFGVPDGAGDVVAPGAFAASLRKRGPSRVRMLYQHFAHEPIGVWETIAEDSRGLYVRGRLIADVERARDVRALIGEGALNGLSIGFRTIRARRDPATGLRTLLEIELWEISVVTFPLLAGSQVTAIGAKGALLADDIRKAALAVRPANQTVIPGELRAQARSEGRGPRNSSGIAAASPGFPSLRLAAARLSRE